MRAPLIVGLLAVALGASACSSASGPEPVPSSVADGLITEITSPTTPGMVSVPLAVGPSGEALIFAIRQDPFRLVEGRALVLIDRDGVEATISAFDSNVYVHPTVVGERLIAWIERGQDEVSTHSVLVVFDRTTGDLTRFEADDLARGYSESSPTLSDLLVIGDVVIVSISAAGGFLAIEPDGDMTAFGVGPLGITTGLDECAADSRMWAWGTLVSSEEPEAGSPLRVLRVFRVSPGPIVEEATDSEFITDYFGATPDTGVRWPSRCGRSVFGTMRNGDTVELVEIDESGSMRSLLKLDGRMPFLEQHVTQTAIVAQRGAGGDEVWVIDRTSGAAAPIDGLGMWCLPPKTAGDYILWQIPPEEFPTDDPNGMVWCRTYVGRLP